jgi:hypothetical protein
MMYHDKIGTAFFIESTYGVVMRHFCNFYCRAGCFLICDDRFSEKKQKE